MYSFLIYYLTLKVMYVVMITCTAPLIMVQALILLLDVKSLIQVYHVTVQNQMFEHHDLYRYPKSGVNIAL